MPLHYARTQGVAETLINKAANNDIIDAQDHRLETPLHHAARAGLRHVVTVLLDNGADPKGGVSCRPCERVERLIAEAAGNDRNSLERVTFSGPWPISCPKLETTLRSFLATDSETADADQSPLLDLLDRARYDGRFENCEGWTPLHYAAQTGPARIVGALLDKLGSQSAAQEVEARSLFGDTPLLWYVASQGVVNRLLQDSRNKASAASARNVFGDTPLHRATSQEIVEELLDSVEDRGEAARATNAYGETPLHQVQDEGSVNELTKATADVTATDMFGATPLHRAAELGFEEVVRALLAELASKPDKVLLDNLDKQQQSGRTPIFLAASSGKTGIVEALLSLGADPTIADYEGVSPLHQAAWQGVAGMVRLLLNQKGVDPDSTDSFDFTPLHFASTEGVVRELLAKGANPSAVNRFGDTPLHWVRTAGATRVLLVAGADVDARRIDGATPLHLAVVRGNLPVVLELLEGGADFKHATSTNGATALHLADDAAVVRVLIDKGADLTATDLSGATPLHWSESDVAARELIAAEANLEATDRNQETPLHYAVKGGYTDVVKELLRNGASVDATDRSGKTPLHHAAQSLAANLDLVRLLIDYKADCDAESKAGDLPSDLLKLGGKRDVEEIKKLLDCPAELGTMTNDEMGSETPTTDNETPVAGGATSSRTV